MSVCNHVAVKLKVLNTQKRPSKDGPHLKKIIHKAMLKPPIGIKI